MNESNHSTKKAAEISPSQAALHLGQENERLARFFAKLLGEVTFLAAETVEFSLEGDTIAGAIIRNRESFKKLTLKGTWMDPIWRWLAARSTPVFSGAPWSDGADQKRFMATVRTGDTVTSFEVLRSAKDERTEALTCRAFKSTPWQEALELIPTLPQTQGVLNELFGLKSGSLLVVRPPHCAPNDPLSTTLSFTNGIMLGEVTNEAVRLASQTLADNQLVVMTVPANEPLEALMRLRADGIDISLLRLSGIMSFQFINRCCPACARRSSVDQSILASFPPYFQRMSLERYVIGRGCEECGHSGYRRVAGLESTLMITDALGTAFIRGAGHSELATIAYESGYRPLWEDGIRKALDGITTFESVTRVVPQAPEVFIQIWKKMSEAEKGRAASSSSAALFPAVHPATTKQNTRLGPPTILIVEDDPDQRAILELALREASYEVTQAADGVDALEHIERDKPDIIVCDLMMPKMDGSELVGRLKSDPRFSRIPILMLTVIADEEKEYALLDLGADDYCDKTIQRKLLLKRIEKLLSRAV